MFTNRNFFIFKKLCMQISCDMLLYVFLKHRFLDMRFYYNYNIQVYLGDTLNEAFWRIGMGYFFVVEQRIHTYSLRWITEGWY